jgi:hypothetical protein
MHASIKRSSLSVLTAVSLTAVGGAALAGSAVAGSPKQDKPAATHLTVKAVKNPTKGDHYKAGVVGHLRSHHDALAGEPVELFTRTGAAGKSWTDTGESQTTDANGAVSFTFAQSATTEQYQLRFAGDGSYRASKSGTITVHRAKTSG